VLAFPIGVLKGNACFCYGVVVKKEENWGQGERESSHRIQLAEEKGWKEGALFPPRQKRPRVFQTRLEEGGSSWEKEGRVGSISSCGGRKRGRRGSPTRLFGHRGFFSNEEEEGLGGPPSAKLLERRERTEWIGSGRERRGSMIRLFDLRALKGEGPRPTSRKGKKGVRAGPAFDGMKREKNNKIVGRLRPPTKEGSPPTAGMSG